MCTCFVLFSYTCRVDSSSIIPKRLASTARGTEGLAPLIPVSESKSDYDSDSDSDSGDMEIQVHMSNEQCIFIFQKGYYHYHYHYCYYHYRYHHYYRTWRKNRQCFSQLIEL